MRENSGVDLSVFRMSSTTAEMSAREWSVQFDNIKTMVLSRRKSGSLLSNAEREALRGTLQNLSKHLLHMAKNPLAYEISMAEISRRQVVLDSLQNNNLSGGSRGDSSSQAYLGSTAIPATTPNPMLQSDRMMIERQKQTFKEQDDMLGEIGRGVDRLKGHAVTIGVEARAQTKMLGELDANVDDATAALQSETKHALLIREQSRMCWMYICIAAQAVVIVLLLILAFA